MDKKKLVNLFYEHANLFAARNDISVDDVADAQFHASLRLINDHAGSENMMIWIDNQTREFRRGLASSPSWTRRRAAAKQE